LRPNVGKADAVKDLKETVIMTSDYDVESHIRRNFASHWVIKNCPSSFICENKQTWNSHKTGITSIETVKKLPTVIVESENGPQIEEHFNTIAVQFPIKH